MSVSFAESVAGGAGAERRLRERILCLSVGDSRSRPRVRSPSTAAKPWRLIGCSLGARPSRLSPSCARFRLLQRASLLRGAPPAAMRLLAMTTTETA